jgi:hypothetical protein
LLLSATQTFKKLARNHSGSDAKCLKLWNTIPFDHRENCAASTLWFLLCFVCTTERTKQ